MIATIKAEMLKIKEQEEALKTAQCSLRQDAIAEIQTMIDELELSANDFRFPHDAKLIRRNGRSNVAPKYRGPNGELWSGRGRQPIWLVKLINAGQAQSQEDFAITK